MRRSRSSVSPRAWSPPRRSRSASGGGRGDASILVSRADRAASHASGGSMSNVPPPPTNLRGAIDLSSLVNRPDPAAAAPGQPAGGELTLPSLYFEGTDANFNDFIHLSMRVPVLVDLGTERSEQWKQFSPLLERVVGSYAGRLVLVRIDVDANPQLT